MAPFRGLLRTHANWPTTVHVFPTLPFVSPLSSLVGAARSHIPWSSSTMSAVWLPISIAHPDTPPERVARIGIPQQIESTDPCLCCKAMVRSCPFDGLLSVLRAHRCVNGFAAVPFDPPSSPGQSPRRLDQAGASAGRDPMPTTTLWLCPSSTSTIARSGWRRPSTSTQATPWLTWSGFSTRISYHAPRRRQRSTKAGQSAG